jgi:hypothetical protein
MKHSENFTLLNCEQNFSFFIFRFGLTVTGLARICFVLGERKSIGSLENERGEQGRYLDRKAGLNSVE